MRKILWILLCGMALGQGVAILPNTTVLPKTAMLPGLPCTTPTGTHFTESFGDSASLCWSSGPSSCNNTWTITGTPSQSIIQTPASPPANTACTNSVQIALPANAAASITATYTGIATSFDVLGTIRVSSLPASNAAVAFCLAASGQTCVSTNLAKFVIDNGSFCTAGGNFVAVTGAGNSTCVPFSINTWYTFDLHRDSTAANCSLSINGGAANAFTCGSGTPAVIMVGTDSTTNPAMTYAIGNLNF